MIIFTINQLKVLSIECQKIVKFSRKPGPTALNVLFCPTEPQIFTIERLQLRNVWYFHLKDDFMIQFLWPIKLREKCAMLTIPYIFGILEI